MCAAAETARKRYLDAQQRCWGYLFSILGGLVEHCGVPDDQITFLRWNGLQGDERRYLPLEEGNVYTLTGATVFDESDGYWHLGLLIYLNPRNHLPRLHIVFALCVTERNDAPLVKVGIDGKPRTVFLNNPAARNQFCEEIVQRAISTFEKADYPKVSQQAIGFNLTD